MLNKRREKFNKIKKKTRQSDECFFSCSMLNFSLANLFELNADCWVERRKDCKNILFLLAPHTNMAFIFQFNNFCHFISVYHTLVPSHSRIAPFFFCQRIILFRFWCFWEKTFWEINCSVENFIIFTVYYEMLHCICMQISVQLLICFLSFNWVS